MSRVQRCAMTDVIDPTLPEPVRLSGITPCRVAIEGGGWPAGWYLVEGGLEDAAGAGLRLSLGVERSDGVHESVPLPAISGRQLAAPVVFTHAVARAWVD